VRAAAEAAPMQPLIARIEKHAAADHPLFSNSQKSLSHLQGHLVLRPSAMTCLVLPQIHQENQFLVRPNQVISISLFL
jgi:hypothetical protein